MNLGKKAVVDILCESDTSLSRYTILVCSFSVFAEDSRNKPRALKLIRIDNHASATQRSKLQIKHAISPSHSKLKPGQPVPAMTKSV